MSGFGAPIYGDPAAENAGAAAVPGAEPQEVLDPNDPRLTSEALDVNATGDAYAQPAPPPDAKYRAKLKLAQPKDAKGQQVDYVPASWGKGANAQLVFVTGVQASIIDTSGKYDGISVFDFNVATYKGRDGSTKVSTILAVLRRPDGEPWFKPGDKLSARDWIQLLVKALAGEPEVGIETQWEWSCQGCGEAAKKAGTSYPRSIMGMHKFPPDPKVPRAFSPEMRCQVNPAHAYSRARVQIARVLPVSAVTTAK